MKPAMLTAIAVLFVGIQAGQAEKIRAVEIRGGSTIVDSSVDMVVLKRLRPVAVPHNHTHPHVMPGPVKSVQPSFPIPKGKFGISLKDGTKMIGVPKSTSVTLQTTFGNATIPRDQIAKIETANGVTRVYLNNGDRVSGKWVTTVIQFETQFGMLKVPVASLVWLRTSNAGVTTKTSNTSHTPVREIPTRPLTPRLRAIIGGADTVEDS